MRNINRISVLAAALLFALASTLFVAGTSAARVQGKAVLPEGTLRKFATKAVRPEYPTSSLRRGTKGRAVALLELDEYSRLIGVKILEAPDEEIGKSVTEAIKKWKFLKVNTDQGQTQMQGRLTFYFEIIDGKPLVRNPKKFK